MSTDEAAKELVNEFDECLNHLASGTNGIEKYIYERAVSCALIAVDKIILLHEPGRISINVYWNGEKYLNSKDSISYWQQVKEKIKSL